MELPRAARQDEPGSNIFQRQRSCLRFAIGDNRLDHVPRLGNL